MRIVSRLRPRLGSVAVLAAAVMVTSLLPLAATSAQSSPTDPRVIDPAQPCSVDAPAAPFDDRDDIAEVHRASVDCAFTQGITKGADDNTYRPRVAVRRDQMASFILRTLQAAGGVDIPPPADQGFTDVSGNTHEDAINQLAALGVVQGRTADRYAPDKLVRRDQMASFIMRAAGVAFGTELEALGGPHFADVPASNVHHGNVDAGFELFGLTIGQTPDAYAPARSVRRDQMATFLVRLLDITELTDESAQTAATALLADDGGVNDAVDSVTDPVDSVTDPEDGIADVVDSLLP